MNSFLFTVLDDPIRFQSDKMPAEVPVKAKRHRELEAARIAPAAHLTQPISQIYFATNAPRGCRNCVGTAWHSASSSQHGMA